MMRDKDNQRTGRGDFLATLRQDLRYGLRMLWRNPGFSLAAVLTLALGIGGNAAIFTVTNALLLKALPYRNPHELVMLNTLRRGDAGQGGGLSLNRYELIRGRTRSFSGVAVWTIDSFNLIGRGEPQQIPAVRVSPNFFSLLGVKPQTGRTFNPDEGQPDGKPVVMISDNLWRTRFGGDLSAVGQTITLDSAPYTVVGVLPAGIQFPFIAPADVWSPRYFELSFMTPEHLRAGVEYLTAVARLAPGFSIKSASAEMDVLHKQYSQAFPKAPDAGADISMLTGDLQELTVANVHRLLVILSIAVGFVLTIACANVASLLLSRALARSKEIAIRSALGARRSAVIRQLLTESTLLALVSGILGLGLGSVGTQMMERFGQASLPAGFSLSIDSHVLAFTLVISLLTGLIFGIFPAVKLARTNVNSELRDDGRGITVGQARMQVQNLLVIFQIALCVLLLIGASLLIRSFEYLQRVALGFDPENVLSMNISLPTAKYAKADQQIAFFDELMRRVNALPGVRSSSMSAALPPTPRRITPLLLEGQPEVPLAQRPFIIIEAIGTAWFHVMRVPIKAGRPFNEQDNAQGPRVVIVNDALAHRFWPNENAIGKHIVVGRQPAAEVVGVATDVKNSGLAVDSQPQIYLPFPQAAWGNMNLLVRTAIEPHQLAPAMEKEIYSIDPDQPVTNIQTLKELLDGSRAQPRFTMFLLAALSCVALILALVGIYGVLAYMVVQRRPEMGIRMALGAEKTDILRLIVGRGLLLTLTGVGVGLIAAMAATEVLASLLYKVAARDHTTFILVPIIFVAIGLMASYLPARRAMSVDPSEVLRGN